MNNKVYFNKPYLIISLDFELMWGVFDKKTIKTYGENIEGVHIVIPKILEIFNKNNIHATWATVGCLFYKSLADLKLDLPENLPHYDNLSLSTLRHIQNITPENYLKYYSGINLINQIKNTDYQEIATHTFSHYYCLEPGQNLKQFSNDISKSIDISNKNDIKIRSIIFPRNQYSNEYLKICQELGIKVFRGNEDNFIQKPRSQKKLNIFIRILRLLDSYINLTGFNSYSFIKLSTHGLLNIPSSFFFRPYSFKIKYLENLKIKRIKKAMLNAAKKNQLFHLWWHPHNFGKNQFENLSQLNEVIQYYLQLNKIYGMESRNMFEIYKEYFDEKN